MFRILCDPSLVILISR